MNTYYFRINAVDAHVSKDGLDNVIYNVHYSYIGEDANGNVTTRIGVHAVQAPNFDSFVPFDQLTQADVIAWIESDLPVAQMQQDLDLQLAELAAPTKVTLQVPETLDAPTNEEIV